MIFRKDGTMVKTIIYKAGEKTFEFKASFCDALEMCARVQEHALKNGVNLDDVVIISCKP